MSRDELLAQVRDPKLRLILSGNPEIFYRDYRAPSRDRAEAEAAFKAERAIVRPFGYDHGRLKWDEVDASAFSLWISSFWPAWRRTYDTILTVEYHKAEGQAAEPPT